MAGPEVHDLFSTRDLHVPQADADICGHRQTALSIKVLNQRLEKKKEGHEIKYTVYKDVTQFMLNY